MSSLVPLMMHNALLELPFYTFLYMKKRKGDVKAITFSAPKKGQCTNEPCGLTETECQIDPMYLFFFNLGLNSKRNEKRSSYASRTVNAKHPMAAVDQLARDSHISPGGVSGVTR